MLEEALEKGLSLRDELKARDLASAIATGNVRLVERALKKRKVGFEVGTNEILSLFSNPNNLRASELLAMLRAILSALDTTAAIDWKRILLKFAKIAGKRGDVAMEETSRLLLSRLNAAGVPLGFDGNRLLCVAAENGNAPLLSLLLLISNDVDPGCRLGYPICKAAERGHLEIVKILIESGKVDVHARNDGPLRYAQKHGHLHITEYLLGFNK